MKYIIKNLTLGVVMATGCLTACSDKFDMREEEHYIREQNSSRTELVEKTVTLTDTDRMESLISYDERITLEKLIVKGNMKSEDIVFLREELPLLTVLDMKGATLPNNILEQKFMNDNNMLEKIVMPDNLQVIDSYAFERCYALEEVVMNEGLKSINNRVFIDCNKLKKAILPESVVSIGFQCFDNTALDTLYLGENIQAIGDYAFARTPLKLVDFRCVKAELGKHIFDGCQNMERIILYEGLKGIPQYFLLGCKKLKNVDLPNSVESIGQEALSQSGIEQLTIKSGVKVIERNAFSSCENLEKVVVEANPTSWGTSSFSSCTSLHDVVLNNEIKDIPSSLFYDCESLTSIELPDSVENINGSVFNGTGIKSIDLKKTKTIGMNAFGNSKIRNITIPECLTKADNSAFNYCDSLEYVIWKSKANIPYINSGNNNVMIFVDTQNGYIPQMHDNIRLKAIIDNHIDSMYISIDHDKSGAFNCPRRVTYRKLVFRKDFRRNNFQYTQPGVASCWKSITLPISPTKIVAVENGRRLAPFGTEMNEDYCPFWLRKLGENGFEDTSNFEANRPFIIHMPYNPDLYADEYNINSYVDFIGENGVMEPTPVQPEPDMGKGMKFWPNMNTKEPNGMIYVLNAEKSINNIYGGVFVRSELEVNPFETYITIDNSSNEWAMNLNSIFNNTNGNASRTTHVKNNTGKPQINDL